MSLTGYNPYTYARGFRNGEQHLAVLSVSGTIHTLYLDGVQVAQNSSSGNVFATYPSITNTVVGAQANLTQAFQGTIGDVRVYNYAISSNQVSSLYLDRNLVVHYPFDNSVNSLTPNYATLSYDASMVGTPLITTSTNAAIGSGALSLTNTAGVPATQNIYAVPFNGQVTPLRLDPRAGLTIGCWINTTGISNRIMRIFDLPMSAGQKGLSVDISGTNMIYSGWNALSFNDNFSTIVSASTSATAGSNGTAFTLSTAGVTTLTFSTGKATWTWSGTAGYGLYLFNKTGNDPAYWLGSQGQYLTDANAKQIFVQMNTGSYTTPFSLSTSFILARGNYIVSVAIMQSIRNYPYSNLKISLGSSYIIFNNTNTAYTTTGNVSISAYVINSGGTGATSTLMQNNPAINTLRANLCYLALTFTGITSGTNVLTFSNTTIGDGFAISQVSLNLA